MHGLQETYRTDNSSIRSDKGLTLETSDFQSLYDGQFTLSTRLINQILLKGTLPGQLPLGASLNKLLKVPKESSPKSPTGQNFP